MEKKQRLFYLDLIRAISSIIIVTYHFAVHFATESVPLKFFDSGKWGLLGVALFFMVSGASLIYNYSDNFNLKEYYKKRFLGIYPIFWLCYSLIFLFTFWIKKGFFTNEPIYKLILSFLGMDGYLSNYTGTFYLIGDWFLGCIILIYLIFPLLLYLIKKCPKLLFGLATIIYLIIVLKSNFKIPLNQNLFVSLFSFLIGMYFMRYVKNIKLWQAILAGILGIFILITYYYKITNLEKMRASLLRINLAASCFLLFFYYVGDKININFIKSLVCKISKYSYIIFLLHHYIILQVNQYFSMANLNQYGTFCAYLICWIIILTVGKIIYLLYKKIQGL